MRKHYKEQCMETLRILTEAHSVAASAMERGNCMETAALLEECQQAAIAIGKLIEGKETEDAGTEAVHKLEEYCEGLYEVHEELLAAGSSGGDRRSFAGKTKKRFLRTLSQVRDLIRHGMTTEYEAVFLPYKASMWDSLESVWRKLDADPEWNAVVVPIPYFDKNPDGSFRQMHYEASQYPPDVPVISYRSYDIEELHPEAIS